MQESCFNLTPDSPCLVPDLAHAVLPKLFEIFLPCPNPEANISALDASACCHGTLALPMAKKHDSLWPVFPGQAPRARRISTAHGLGLRAQGLRRV